MQGLKPLKRRELVVGDELSHHLRDEEGRIIIEAGSVLDHATVTFLPDTVYVRRDVRSEMNPEDVVGALFLRLGKAKPTLDERRHERRAWSARITVTILQRSQHDYTEHTVEVVTHDISQGGFSFIYPQFIPLGSTVQATFDMLPNSPMLTGTVRNCVLLTGMKHRVGVSFDRIKRG